MTRALIVALILGALPACGGKQGSTTPAQPGTGQAMKAKTMAISWGLQPTSVGGEAFTDVYLAATNETGSQVSHSIGRYKGVCEKFTPRPAMQAVTGVKCVTSGGGGTELHAVSRESEVIILQVGYEGGIDPDPMAREQVTAIAVPRGVAVDVAP